MTYVLGGVMSGASDGSREGVINIYGHPGWNRTGSQKARQPRMWCTGQCFSSQTARWISHRLTQYSGYKQPKSDPWPYCQFCHKTSFLCWLYQDVMARAQVIILHGHQLSANHHYAMALIMQRCNELRYHCDTLNSALKAKHSRLLHTHQLLICLGQVLRCASIYTNIKMYIFIVLHMRALPSGPNVVWWWSISAGQSAGR